MPRDSQGNQYINFASVADPDASYSKYIWVKARNVTRGRHDTIKAMAARRSQPEMAGAILQLNLGRDVLPHPPHKPHHKVPPQPKLKSITNPLRPGVSIKLPGTMAQGFFFQVMAGDKPPVVKKAYAEFDEVKVPGRVSLNRFLGYPPIQIDLDIQFDAFGDEGNSPGFIPQQGSIEDRITALERMGGRGLYPGSGFGPPAVIVVNTTDNAGNIVPLIPIAYQWTPQHQNAPQFRVTNIAWAEDALRNSAGYRVRQSAVVTITQYTPLVFVTRSCSTRFQMSFNKKKSTPPKAKATKK
jgi:hypothetical protein